MYWFFSGLFYVYSGTTLVAVIYMYFLVPETRGISLEKVDTLFMTNSEKHLISYIYSLHEIGNSVMSWSAADDGDQRD